jgi:hypothetical protein
MAPTEWTAPVAAGRTFSLASAAPRTPGTPSGAVLANSPAVVAAIVLRRLRAAPLDTNVA